MMKDTRDAFDRGVTVADGAETPRIAPAGPAAATREAEPLVETPGPAEQEAAEGGLTMSPGRAGLYIAASVVLAMTQGLSRSFISNNLPQIAGQIGATQTEAMWLLVVYLVPRASLPLLLIKIRGQVGLRRFAEVGIALFLVAATMGLWIDDLHSAIVVEFVSGCAAAPLSSMAILYMLEPLPRAKKLTVGMPLGIMMVLLGQPLAGVLSPPLLNHGGWTSFMVLGLGLAMIAFAFVYTLPLGPQERRGYPLSGLDLVSYAFVAVALGGLTVFAISGTTQWWTAQPWLGELLVVAMIAAICVAVVELNREEPLLDIKWLASPTIVHLTGVLLVFRLVLSEQSSGASRLFRQLGMGPEQMQPLWGVIVVASLAGGFTCAALLKPGREPWFHAVALALIAMGAFMDGDATAQTRPEQMYASQALIGYASMLFLPSALLKGFMTALAKGMNYIFSFVIVFLTTQLVGAMLGSAAFASFIRWRKTFHAQVLSEQVLAGAPETADRIDRMSRAYAPMVADPAARTGQAIGSLNADISTQAYVMAYNDAFLLIGVLAASALGLLVLHAGLGRVLAQRDEAAEPA